MTVSNEEALKEALIYIAECLERDEMYRVQDDWVLHGEAIKRPLAEFARRIGSGDQLEKWRAWCERKRA